MGEAFGCGFWVWLMGEAFGCGLCFFITCACFFCWAVTLLKSGGFSEDEYFTRAGREIDILAD